MLKAKLATDAPGALGSHPTAPVPRHTDEITEWVAAAACRGEHAAFAAILRHYDRRLRVVAYRMLRDRDLVDDALQDVALRAFQALPQFRGEASLGT
jgi:RNA polymerase sigma-70 factor (ECF subfamily)